MIMGIDLTSTPLIDTHCHPFALDQAEISVQEMRDAISVSLRGPSSPENETMLLGRLLVRSLSRLLDCEATWEAVVEARNAKARDDVRMYYQSLFDDANIRMLLIDSGFPLTPLITAQAFSEVMPCPVLEGYRIERFTMGTSFHDSGFASLTDFVEAIEVKLDEQAANPGVRFFKSVIAYLTGLDIHRVSEAEANAAWADHSKWGDLGEKILRDFLFWRVALKAREHDLPFQVHTGHTSNFNPWPNVNPILLTRLLNENEMSEVRFVLVHGGYPYCTEAGYITSVYPNVALDLSLMIPWSSIGIARRIEETLESAPTSKVMYGSDAIHCAEMYWVSSLVSRKALSKVLDRLVEEDVVDVDEAMEIAKAIFYRNAERIYGVSLPH
jgi:uncharacterized protein